MSLLLAHSLQRPARRAALAKLAALGAVAGFSLLSPFSLAQAAAGVAAPGTPVQVVYHVADGNDQAFRALVNANNHLKAEPGTRIVIVALAHGVDFLVEGARDRNGNAFAESIAALSAMGVQFRVCNNSLKGMNIDPSKLVLEAKVVTSGVAEIARLQAREGYVYLRP